MPLLTTKRPLAWLLLAAALAIGTAHADESDQKSDQKPDQASEQAPGPGSTEADDARPTPDHARPPRKRLSPEERAALRERYENMSDEDKQALREKRAARRAKWEAMSEEERKAAREKMRQQRAPDGS